MHRVVLVDDQVLFVESLKSVIQNRAADFEVVGAFYDADTALGAIEALKPDLVLMDVRMPGIDGVQATRKVMELCPDTRVVMLTTYDEDEYLTRAFQYGAVGYLLKDMPPDSLLACMRSAVSGQFQMPTKLANRLLTKDQGAAGVSDADLPDWLYELSRKERSILRLIVEGYTNDEIARQVFLAPQTVKNYISRLYGKADVDSRPHLIRVSRSYIAYL